MLLFNINMAVLRYAFKVALDTLCPKSPNAQGLVAPLPVSPIV